MTTLCRATGVRVGLITDGEQWTLVSVPADGGSSLGTWYARIWQQEPVTLQAFVSLLEVRRCFGRPELNLDSLFLRSLEHQDEVTDTLGEQVRRAVEVLVQALDRADLDRDRELLKDVSPAQLYEAGLTVMMRLVVLLCAEERKLLLLGEPIYGPALRRLHAPRPAASKIKSASAKKCWNGGTMPGRGCSPFSAPSSAASSTRRCGCRRSAVRSSIPTVSPSSKAAPPARAGAMWPPNRCPSTTAPCSCSSPRCRCWSSAAARYSSPTRRSTWSRSATSMKACSNAP